MNRPINKFLFWVHVALIISFVAIGMVVSPFAMLMIIAIHRAHLFVLGECAVSKMQRRLGGLPQGMNFLQLVSQKVLNKHWSFRQAQLVDYSIAIVAFTLSCVHALA